MQGISTAGFVCSGGLRRIAIVPMRTWRVRHRLTQSVCLPAVNGRHKLTIVEAGFFTPFWRNTLFLSLAAVGFYKWAPKSDEDAYLTKWLSHYSTPREVWAAANEQQLLRSQEVAINNVLQTSAQRPSMVRYRYPQ